MGPKRMYELGAKCPFGCGTDVVNEYNWKICHWNSKTKMARCTSRQKQVAAYHSAPHQHGVDTPNFMESNAVDQQSFSDNASIIVRDNEMSRPTFPTQAEGANVFSTDLDGLDKVITSIIENASDDDSDGDISDTSNYSDSDTICSDSDDESIEDYSQAQEHVLSRIEKMRSELVIPDHDGDETRNYNVKELALFLQRFQDEANVPQKLFDELLRVLREKVLPDGNNLPKSKYMLDTILDAENGWDYSVHYCRNMCCRFENIRRSEWKDHCEDRCTTCEEKRFDVDWSNDNERIVRIEPNKFFFYFGVEMAIKDMFASTDFARLRAWQGARSQDDIWTSTLVKEMDEKSDGKILAENEVKVSSPDGIEETAFLRDRCLIDLGYDGAKIWNHITHSTGFLAMRTLDVPFWQRGKKDNVRLLALFPGPKEPDSDGMKKIFMQPFVEEMEKLERVGFKVDDKYLGKEYILKVHLATVSADTPARSTVSCTSKQNAMMGDSKSIMKTQTVKLASGKKFSGYFTGYGDVADGAEPVVQDHFEKLRNVTLEDGAHNNDVPDPDGKYRLYATDHRLFLDHEKCVKIHDAAKAGVLNKQECGREPDPPLARIPFFDICFGHVIPWVHAGLYGVLKDFIYKVILSDPAKKNKKKGKKKNRAAAAAAQPQENGGAAQPHENGATAADAQPQVIVPQKWVMPGPQRKQMSELAKYVKLPSDNNRPYKDIVKLSGTYVMEDWAVFLEVAPIFHELMYEWCPAVFHMWKLLRSALLHYFCSHGWYDGMDPDQKRKANKNAMVNMLKYAWYVQTYVGAFMCTLCLRLIAVHGCNQEDKTGPARHTTEYWLERHIGDHKKAFRRHGITKNPELYAANRYLRKVKIANFLADSSVRDLRSDARKDARCRSPTASADDKRVYDGHFLGKGTTMDKDFDGKSELIDAAMQRYPTLLRKDDIELIKTDIEFKSFQSASKLGEVFHSNEYTRTSSSKRSSRHVSFVPGFDHVERQFGEVKQYWMLSYEDVKIRMCELQHHVKTTNEHEQYLDYESVRLSEPEQKFVALKDIKQKMMFFTTPDLEKDDKCKVIQMVSLGRIIADKT
jgi:hypothetical protein